LSVVPLAAPRELNARLEPVSEVCAKPTEPEAASAAAPTSQERVVFTTGVSSKDVRRGPPAAEVIVYPLEAIRSGSSIHFRHARAACGQQFPRQNRHSSPPGKSPLAYSMWMTRRWRADIAGDEA